MLAIKISQNNLSVQKETIFWHTQYHFVFFGILHFISPLTFFMLWFESIHSRSPSLSRFVIAVTHFEFQMYYTTTLCMTISFRAEKYLYFTRTCLFLKKHWSFLIYFPQQAQKQHKVFSLNLNKLKLNSAKTITLWLTA